MAQCLICYFIGILFYIERKGLLMRNAATILHLRSKSYYASGQKFHYVDIQKYTDICFQRVSSMQFLSVRKWCIAIFLSDTKQKKVYWKTCIVRQVFGCVVGSILFSISSDLKFIK